MSSSFILFSLLIASTMAFPHDFPPYNFPPFNFPPNYKFPPYNFPPFSFPPYPYYHTPPPSTGYGVPPPGNGYAQAPPPPKHNHYGTPPPSTHYRVPPPGNGYVQAPPPPNHNHYGTPPPPKGNHYGKPPPPKGNHYGKPPPPKDNHYGNPPPAAPANDKNDFLAGQNAARKAVTGAYLPDLAWNETLAAYALNYANKRKGDCALQHSGGPYGENIAEGGGLTAKEAVSLWVDEKSYYNYASNGCAGGEMCGHYTQIVWKQTTQLGCARVTCDDSTVVFATCNYSPPGNYVGERPY